MVLLESQKLEPGMQAPNFSLPGTDDKMHSLQDYDQTKALIIVFMCNHCPYVHAVQDRLIEIQKDYQDKGVQVIGINANDAANYPDDNFDSMKATVEKVGINFPYLHDESQEVAKAYKAQCTPDIYVFDNNRTLAYHGRIDDNWQEPEKVEKHELREALDKILAGEKPDENQKPSMGCSIKWKE